MFRREKDEKTCDGNKKTVDSEGMGGYPFAVNGLSEEAPTGLEPVVADLQSAPLAIWVRRPFDWGRLEKPPPWVKGVFRGFRSVDQISEGIVTGRIFRTNGLTPSGVKPSNPSIRFL